MPTFPEWIWMMPFPAVSRDWMAVTIAGPNNDSHSLATLLHSSPVHSTRRPRQDFHSSIAARCC